MARRIYTILIIISIALGVYLNSIKDTHSKTFLLLISSAIFLLFSMGIHGLLAHLIKPNIKRDMIIYPLFMGVIWVVLFALFVFFIVPIFCPNFIIMV